LDPTEKIDAQTDVTGSMESSIQIPGYKILRELGQGGMAHVYLAIQESFGREVALKVLAPHLTDDEEFSKRFLREAPSMANTTICRWNIFRAKSLNN